MNVMSQTSVINGRFHFSWFVYDVLSTVEPVTNTVLTDDGAIFRNIP